MSEFDSELLEQGDEYEGESDLSYLPEQDRDVYIERFQLSVFEIHRRYKRNDIVLKPFYQRSEDVWTRGKKTKLIESVLRNIPIPSIYFAETEEEKWEVVDGQQRLKSFFDFMDAEYALAQPPVLASLKNKKFSQLDSKQQRKLEDYQLHIFLIKKESHPDIRFDIFERINEGATQLNAQELRNSFYRGDRIKFLVMLSRDSNFKKVTYGKLQTNRLKDQEAILRFLSFYTKGFNAYNGNLNAFLNETLEYYEHYIDEEKVRLLFSETMQTIYDVFGAHAFIKPGIKRQKMNISLFDILSYSFAKYPKHLILEHKEEIVKILNRLIQENETFNLSITSNTLTKQNVNYRFNTWLNEFETCIGWEEAR